MANFYRFFLTRPLLVHLVTFLVFIMGLTIAYGLNRQTYPNVNFDILKVATVFPGASAEDVAVNVTKVIEDEILKVNNLDRVKSSSLENLSLIYVFIDPDSKDREKTKDEVIRAVLRVQDLPPEVEDMPEIEEIKSSNMPVVEVSLVGDNYKNLRELAKNITEDLKQFDGVADVNRSGYLKKEVKIDLDLEKMIQNYVSYEQVIAALQNQNIKIAGGDIPSQKGEKKVVTAAEFENLEDVKNVIVRSNFSGQTILLKEIASIKEGFEKPQILFRTNGNESIHLTITRQSEGDIIEISQKIKNYIAQFNAGSQKAKLTLISDFSHYTESLLNIVTNNGLLGFGLVLLILFLFLSFYTAIWTAVGIPLSIFGAVILFPLTGVDINSISLITLILVLGLLVDDAIVVAENISRHREMGKKPIDAAIDALGEIFWPVVTTVITTILAFLPMYFMIGITGKFMTQMATVVILTLGFSLIESLLILPAHIVHSPKDKPRVLGWFEKLKNIYAKQLKWCLNHRLLVLGGFLLFLMSGLMTFKFGLKFILFPYDDVDMFYVIAELEDGTSLAQTQKKLIEVETIIDEIPKDLIEGYTMVVGHHDTDSYGGSSGLHTNWGLVSIYLKPASERYQTSEVIMEEVNQKIAKLSGYQKLYVQKFYDGPPIGKPITLTLVSDDDELRRNWAQKIRGLLDKTNGVQNLQIDERLGKAEVHLIPNLEVMARLGVTVSQISQAVRMAYDGIVATDLTRDGEEIDYRVLIDQKQSQKLENIDQLTILNPNGRLLKLGDLILEKEIKRGYQTIFHYDGRRSITITADIDEAKTTSVEVNQLLAKEFEKPIQKIKNLDLIFGGEEKATQESMQSFFLAFIGAMLAIYCVLVILFNSLWQPMVILSAVPFGLVGVFFAFFAHGIPLSFLGMIGILGLIGIVVNDSLIMVSYINQLRKQKGGLTKAIIVKAGRTRFRAVWLTTITTVFGMIPTIYGFGGYEPFVVPVVLAVAGGLIFATMIVLVLIPTLMSIGVKE